MARNFDGTNDNLLTADNACPNLDQDAQFYWGWFDSTDTSGLLFTVMSANGAGNFRSLLATVIPVTAGYRFEFDVQGGTDGVWRTNDIATGRHHFAVIYNRSDTTNNPVIYIDNVPVTVNIVTVPITIAATDWDTLKFGENAGGGQDFAGSMAFVGAQAGVAADAAMVNRTYWWGRPGGGVQNYYPLLTDKLTNEGSENATLTATGTTVASLVTPVVVPGSSMMGMGIGW